MGPDDGNPVGPGEAEHRGATLDLDALLRGERAAVTVTVALSCGATTYADRERLERIGGELVVLDCALRERLDLAGRSVPLTTDYEAHAMLATESYDARLAALADFLDAAAGRATTALSDEDEDEDAYMRTLRDLIAFHAQAAEWLRERAATFAASRPANDPWDDARLDAPGRARETTDGDTGSESARDGPRDDGEATP